jgi:acylphosphatase
MNLHIIVSGLVQGVGYREWFRRQAFAAGVTGWVRNRADGTVEAVLSGPSESVEGLATEAAKGPPGARVDTVRRCLAEASAVDPANPVFFIAPSH